MSEPDHFTNRVKFLREQAEKVELQGFSSGITPRWIADVLRVDAALLTSSVSKIDSLNDALEPMAALVLDLQRERASLHEALGVFRPYADVFENVTLTDIEFGRLRDKLDPLLRAAARASRGEAT